MSTKAAKPKTKPKEAQTAKDTSAPAKKDVQQIGSVSTLKALAHPIRHQLFRALISKEHARAADLAADLGIPANKISFHLRVLADAEIIEEAPELARDKRDRVWKPKSGSFDLGGPGQPVEDEALAKRVAAWAAADLHSTIERLVNWAPEYFSGRSSKVHGSMMTSYMTLTDEEFEQLLEQLSEVMERFRGREKQEGSRRWQVNIVTADEDI